MAPLLSAAIQTAKPKKSAATRIRLNSLITVESLKNHEVLAYAIVEDKERVEPVDSTIYVVDRESPFYSVAIGKKVGECFSLRTKTRDVLVFRVVKISPIPVSELRPRVQTGPKSRSNHLGEIEDTPSIFDAKLSESRNSTKTLDGSYGLGWLVNEGRFSGSYPAHDDYGDESSPEGRELDSWANSGR